MSIIFTPSLLSLSHYHHSAPKLPSAQIKFEPYAQPITPTRAAHFTTSQSDTLVAESATPTTTTGLGTTIPTSAGSDRSEGLKMNV